MKNIIYIFAVIITCLILVLTIGCKKDSKAIPTLSTEAAIDITTTSATSGGAITNDGKSPVTTRGVCWSTNQNPTITDSKTTDGSGIGSFTSLITGLTPGTTYYIRAYATNAVGTAYGNQIIARTKSTQEQKNIIASVGGTLTTGESVQLVIPANALPADGVVFIGRTGNEPTSVPNPDLKVVGNPVTLRLPSDVILKPLQLSFPAPSGTIDTTIYSVFIYNGLSYFPVKYTINGGTVTVTIDAIDLETMNVSTKASIGEKIIIALEDYQNPAILASQMGLKEARIQSGSIDIYTRQQVNSSSKVLLLIHGWGGWPSTWEDFLKKIDAEPNHLSYTNYWTFGYNSSLSISENGKILNDLLGLFSKGATIDIVAHSMGGLVSRSMIEQHGGAQYINNLVTLGTPHKGSPLAALRNVIGFYVFFTSAFDLINYNYNTQGFRDLNTGSKFVDQMMALTKPPKPYYTIACTNDGIGAVIGQLKSSSFITGLDDGIVSVESALGVNGASTPDNIVNISIPIAHLDMRKNDPIYIQVRDYLKRQPPLVSTANVTNITNTSLTCGGNITNDGGTSVTSRGVCWSTSQSPTTANSKITNGIGIGSFTSTISGLTPGTTYYIKAFAVNSTGTGYGDQVTATTKTLAPNSIEIISYPSGASVYLDGTNMNTITPATLTNVNVGYHNVRLFKFGYNEYLRDIYLVSGESFSINANLGNPVPPLPVFSISQPLNNSHLSSNVLTVSGYILLRSASGSTSNFTGNHAILTLNGVDQEIPVSNGSFSQKVLISAGENRLRLRANSTNGDTGISNEITFYGDFTVSDIQIVLRWNNGTDQYGSNKKDVDLHVYDSNNRHTYWLCTSAYSGNTGYTDAVANKIPGGILDIDNTWGFGPETFTLKNATTTTYSVWAHFYSGYQSSNPTYANIEITLKGNVTKTYGPYRFNNSFDKSPYTMYNDPDCWWNVVSFTVSGGLANIASPDAPIIDMPKQNNLKEEPNQYKPKSYYLKPNN